MIGTGKPFLGLLYHSSGILFEAAFLRMYLVVLWDSLYLVGMVLAKAKTSLSRIGTLSSREFAMAILSAFRRMSFGSQKCMSRYCILVRSSLSFTSS